MFLHFANKTTKRHASLGNIVHGQVGKMRVFKLMTIFNAILVRFNKDQIKYKCNLLFVLKFIVFSLFMPHFYQQFYSHLYVNFAPTMPQLFLRFY